MTLLLKNRSAAELIALIIQHSVHICSFLSFLYMQMVSAHFDLF